jgi:hypothetical protein
MGRGVHQITRDLRLLILPQLQNLGADHDIAILNMGLEAAAEASADNQVGPVATDRHFGSDAGAFLSDAKRQQRDGLSGQCAFVEIEMFLAHEMVGISATEDGPQFLADGNEDGYHRATGRRRGRRSG